MAATSSQNDIMLFHYPFSPFARRITWYLQLRGIPYTECIQPFILPRPDLEALGVKYRRIPLLTMGRDVYLDTRLVIRKLEERFPEGKLGSEGGEGKFVEGLLERYMVEGPVFWAATGLIPPGSVRDPKFAKDRQGFGGREWTPESLEAGRGECLSYIRNLFDFLENSILADGREWVLKGSKPSLADIEAIWPFDWLVHMKGSLPPKVVSEQKYPRVFAWIQRFRAALDDAGSSAPKPEKLNGPEAVRRILAFEFHENSSQGKEDTNDEALELQVGEEVEVYPADWGSEHRDRGRLVRLTQDEVVVGVKAGSGAGDREIRIHAPQTGFKITKVGKSPKL